MAADTPADSDRIDEAKVQAIARLARLTLTDAEVASFTKQFTDIIQYFHLLDDAAVEDVTPAYLLTVLEGEMRPDEPRPGIDREEFLREAPAREGNQVRVAPIRNLDEG